MKKEKPYDGYGGCLIIPLIILLLLLYGCYKQQDYSYLNTDRRPKMVRVSKWFEFDWTYRDSSFKEVTYNPELLRYRDTTVFPASCPPPNGIEVRYYLTK